MVAQNTPPTINVIRLLLQHSHELSVYAKSMPYAIKAEITELDADSNRMVMEIEYAGQDFEQYLADGSLNVDLEALKGTENPERDTYSLTNIPTKVHKTDNTRYRLDCQLPDSVFMNESKGAIRVPLVLGMNARVNIEVYPHTLHVPGNLRNLSVGGCMVEIDLVESIAISPGMEIPGVSIEFPNGEHFHFKGVIRHIRPFGSHGYAAVGIRFTSLTTSQSEALFHCVNETEREAAHRSGMAGSMIYPSPLFVPGTREKLILLRENQEREKNARLSPVELGVIETAHRIQVGLMYIKSRNLLPLEIFYDCVDTLLSLVKKDRKALLYALSLVRDEPDWVRHAVQVSGKLADMLLLRDPHDPHVREAVLGTLLHTMGKPLLVSADLPSLKVNMNPAQKKILSGHVTALRTKLQDMDWEPSPVCRDVIENANECLDGSGYPAGKQAEQLSELIQRLSLIKIINKFTNERNGISPRTPMSAYRKVYEAAEKYNKAMLVEYVQTYGFYPIGSLAKYSGGFLGWVMDINNKGKPTRVNIVKNLRFLSNNINTQVADGDLAQIGKLENIVNPADYGMRIQKL